ncbi:hypothetical protein [Streptomyces sp. NPDC026589]|uniref:hypothetical protein n=1 Tax=Streptomyces sp. NPDC026589 TaxID=3155609 RepID=UPI003403E642
MAAWRAVSAPETAHTPETVDLLTETAEQLAAAGADRLLRSRWLSTCSAWGCQR